MGSKAREPALRLRQPASSEGEHMTNARQILEEFTASLFVDPKKAAKCLLQNGAFEMPYLDSLSACRWPFVNNNNEDKSS
jgi:hypothetical protein